MKRLLLLILLFSSISGFSREKRLALVIGNSAYVHGGVLKNPVNDAMAMEQALTRVGFEVMVFLNLDQTGMKRVIDDFGNHLKDFDVGLFYYAGHGIQSKGINYLIPVDADLSSENDVEYNCIDAGRILGKMEDASCRTNIIILDACRNNPFERSWTRSTHGRGLASMDAPIGSLIAYATAPGTTASDGPGINGLYTSALVRFIIHPGLSIEEVFKQVRIVVVSESEGIQMPWESTSLMGDFYFNTNPADSTATNAFVPTFESSDPGGFRFAREGTFTDPRNGSEYSWIKIGDQIWMAENLNYPASEGSWCYENQGKNCTVYGRLYNWEAAQHVCPEGWRLPSDDEWKKLEMGIGLSQADANGIGPRGVNTGGKLKENGRLLWRDPNTGASNEYEFNALPGGFRSDDGVFYSVGYAGYWWCSTDTNTISAWGRDLHHTHSSINRNLNSKKYAFSIRCIKE
jgi:uncharacterized protein (TIGR02145 family)